MITLMMSKNIITAIFMLSFCLVASAQSIQELIDMVDQNNLELKVAELSGEQSTIITGTSQTITSRVHSNNDLAAEYIKEQLEALPNLTVNYQNFNTAGKNVIATQLGQTNPDNIYIVCAHYDSVTTYCADDNATGVSAVLEIARILSTQCLDNTIIYALWDEEEVGLLGADFYATQAADSTNGNTRDNIIAVVNMDMVGFDGDAPGTPGDNDFDIDVRPYANSLTIKDDLLDLFNSYSFNLNPIVVNPGTFSSDHSRFWLNDFSAVLVGESWETNDQTPDYHTSGDRIDDIDFPYFTDITKLVLAYMATKGGLLAIDNTVSQTETTLTANLETAVYQWYNADTDTPILNATNREFTPTENGLYSVEITINGCTERSEAIPFNALSTAEFSKDEINVYPNPTTTYLIVESQVNVELTIRIIDVNGKQLRSIVSTKAITNIDIQDLSAGVYFVSVNALNRKSTFQIVKE
ncbi:MAG: M28 family peptidase [Winogradskyella sp.]|nr:M28 family peptidase [Winogradskyella sp.]